MDINNNDFFGEIKNDEFDNMNISNSGINYGETDNKFSLKTILIAVGVGAIVAGLLTLLFIPNKNKSQPNNFADIPTIPSPQEPIKIVPEEVQINEVYQNASIYNPTNFEEAAQNLIDPNQQQSIKLETVPQIQQPKIKTIEVKKPTAPKKKKIAKATSVKKAKIKEKEISQPKFIEKATNVKGEVEISKLSWNVQLTSTSSEAAANKEWTNLLKKHPEIFNGLSHTVSKTDINGKTYYRLRISNLESSEKAVEICNKLKAQNLSCFITK